MSGTTDLLSVAQTLTGDLLGGTTPGRLSSMQIATNLDVTITPASGTSPATYNVTTEGIFGGSGAAFRNTPAYEFTNARDDAASGTTQIDVQSVNRFGTVSPPTTFTVVAVDQHHVLLMQPISGAYIIIADNDTLNPNAPDAAFPPPSQTGNLLLSQTTANGTPFCFATGTQIQMADGVSLVETIRAGDLVMTANGVREVIATVSRRVRLRAEKDAGLAMPVRIKAGAFAPSVPVRDLLLSPDHAIVVDGALIAARRLVNGSSIVVERTMSSVRYVHIELAEHGVLFAEGLATESYLDCGKRAQLDTGHDVISLVPTLETTTAAYAERGCAPLVTDAATIVPVWQRLSARASEIGFAIVTAETTTDAGLCVTADGVALTVVSVDGAEHAFAVPAGVSSVRVRSRSASPADTQPWLDDRRTLGVAISRVTIGTDALALDEAAGTGWHADEGGHRWTDGNAVLAIPTATEARVLTLSVAGTLAYAVAAEAVARAA